MTVCVSPVRDWQPLPCLSHLRPCATLVRISRIEDEGMNE